MPHGNKRYASSIYSSNVSVVFWKMDVTAEQPRTARLHGSACDTCRRRRVKCDGNQPCDRCTRSGVACTYGSVASRTSAVSYARQLEQKVAELQGLLRERPQADSSEGTAQVSEFQELTRQQAIDMLIGPGNDYVYRLPETSSNIFYGRFGGLSVLRSVGDIVNPAPAVPPVISPGRSLIESFEVSTLSPPVGVETKLFGMLPSKPQVQEFVNHAMRTALVCHDCIDHVRFPLQLDQLYTTDPEDYSLDDKKFLALVYALVALGRRYLPSTADDEIDETGDKVKLKGLSYFHASYEMTHIIDSHGLDSIRAIIYQARYLMSASMMSKAYSLICTGAGTALRMGLHISSPALRLSFSSDELLQRRRVFATLNMADTYLSSLLGLPKILRNADPEQTLGLRDEDILDGGQAFILQNPTELSAESALCQKLNNILAKVNEQRFQANREYTPLSGEFYDEDPESVTMREAEIQEWHNELPTMEGPSDIRVIQTQLHLRLWHSLAQIILYRPFLHHLARDRQDSKFNIRGYECGSACVRAAMQAVLVVETFKTNDILHEGYWLNIYMLEFSASILAYFVTSSVQRTTVEESMVAAWKANNMLAYLGKYSLAARRCFKSLNSLLSTLPVVPQNVVRQA